MDATASTTQEPLSGLAKTLLCVGALDEVTARKALMAAKKEHKTFESQLITDKILPATEIARIGSEQFGVPFLDLDYYDTDCIATETVSESLIQRHNVLPLFQRDQHLYVAMSDPSRLNALHDVQFHTGLHTHCVVVEAHKLQTLIDNTLNNQQNAALKHLLGDVELSDLEIVSSDSEGPAGENTLEGADDAPVVRFVHKILLDAINRGASDIHFEIYEKDFRIRFRLDGILSEISHPPLSIARRIVTRLKVMAQMDISERRLPQDGRFKLNLAHNRAIDFRVSTCPTVNGEKVVMRILDPSLAQFKIDSLGVNESQKNKLLGAIQDPQGMILVTGPTGSGKTITLYTALNILNTVEKNISTAEDPVEIKLSGINQVNINTKTGLTFASTLRSFLRQDPDIILVGEMRDLETVEIGVKAAQTGHLVLSTLHTNNATETINRLSSLGMSSFNLATSLRLIIAQRLARRLCEKCKVPHQYPATALIAEGFAEEEAENLKLFEPKGCEQCHQGYKGRVGLFEVLDISKSISELILAQANSQELAAQARKEGMITLHEAGLEKVRAGITSLTEINRVIKD